MREQHKKPVHKPAGGIKATHFYSTGAARPKSPDPSRTASVEKAEMEKVEHLTQILRRICAGEDIETVVEQTKDFLMAVEQRDVSLAELKLFESNYSVSYLERLCTTHLQLFGSWLSIIKAQLAPNHILAKIMAEHELMLCFLADLEDVNYEIRKMKGCATVTTEFRKLAHIVSHLRALDEHRELEDEIIFLELERRGCYGLLAMVKAEHLCLDISTDELLELVTMAEEMDFRRFKTELSRVVQFLVPSMREHIFKEDNIFLPIALEIINEPGAWEKMKGLCDQIGYCPLHP